VKTAESMAIEVVRLLILASQQAELSRVTVTVCEEVATYLNNRKRRELTNLEDDNKITVQVLSREGASPEHLNIECHDGNGRELKFSN
jgi:ribonuclease E